MSEAGRRSPTELTWEQSLGCDYPLACDGMDSSELHVSTALIGHTGFVGSNLRCQYPFDHLYNSTNIREIEGRRYDLIVCAGLPGLKWLANQNPGDDKRKISLLETSLRAVSSRRFVLISTTDVYPKTVEVDERFDCKSLPNHRYGQHRLEFEEFARGQFENVFVLRLPGLFGPSLKKNILYDLLTDTRLELINAHSVFQWYDITQLWSDITMVVNEGIRLINLVTEPLTTSMIIGRYFSTKIVGGNPAPPAAYDVSTVYSEQLGGRNGYLKTKEDVLERIGAFIRGYTDDQKDNKANVSILPSP